MKAIQYKVYYKLEESVFIFNNGDFTFHFSSKDKLRIFKRDVEAYRVKLALRIQPLGFICEVNIDDYADFLLYAVTEKRGFHVTSKDGEVYKWLRDIKLDGVIKTPRKSKTLSETSTLKSND